MSFSFYQFWKEYKYILISVGVIAYLWFFRKKSPLMTMKTWDFLLIVILMAYFIGESFMDTLRYRSPQLQAPAFHCSLGDSPVPFMDQFDDYFIIRMGGCNALGVAFRGSDGVMIASKNLCSVQGGELHVDALIQGVDISELPSYAQDYIRTNNLHPPYLLAVLPVSLAGIDSALKIVDAEEFVATNSLRVKVRDRVISEMADVLANKRKVQNEYNADASATAQSFNKSPSIIDRLTGGSK